MDKNGIVLAVEVTGANRHDVTQIIRLVEDIPHIQGKVGRSLHKPKIIQGDRGYGSEPKRKELKKWASFLNSPKDEPLTDQVSEKPGGSSRDPSPGITFEDFNRDTKKHFPATKRLFF